MDIMLEHLLIKVNTYMLSLSLLLFIYLFVLLSQMNNQRHQHVMI